MAEQSLKEKTAKGLFWGGLSNGTQQLLNLLFGIFLSRILNADDYGMVGVLAIFSSIASSLQESGFIAAIANKKDVTHKDYNAVFWFNILVGSFLYIVLFFSAPFIADYFKEPRLVILARVSFLCFLITSFSIAHRAVLFKNLKVKETAITSIVSLFLSGVVGVTFAYSGYAYWSIVAQNLVFVTSVTLFNWYFSKWRPTFSIDFTPLKSMIGFSCKLLATNIFMQINNNIFLVFLGRYYTKRDTGLFSQASKWNTMGFSTIGGMIQSVAQPILAQINEDSIRQKAVFRKMLRFTAFVSFPAMFGLSLISKEIITITITAKWLESAALLSLLAIGGAFSPICQLFSNLIISNGKSNVYMWSTIALCCVQLLSMLAFYPYGIHTMIVASVIINGAWLFVWYFFAWKYIRLSLFELLKDIIPFLLLAAVSIGIAYYLTLSMTDIYLSLTCKIVIAASVYILVLWLLHAAILKESIDFLLKKNSLK